MNAILLGKMLIGALMVLAIQLLAASRHYHLAALAPLFPAFALISHYILGSARSPVELKSAVLFGIFALIPYLLYLLTVFLCINRLSLIASMAAGLGAWCAGAVALILLWQRLV